MKIQTGKVNSRCPKSKKWLLYEGLVASCLNKTWWPIWHATNSLEFVDWRQVQDQIAATRDVLTWRRTDWTAVCAGTSASTLKYAARVSVWTRLSIKEIAVDATRSAGRANFVFMGCVAMHDCFTNCIIFCCLHLLVSAKLSLLLAPKCIGVHVLAH
jgi:hypothetical protein